MRIVTRADFDGVVCAVILFEALEIKQPVKWVEPSEIQKGQANIREGDILANLPYNKNCSMWFDHHYSNRIDHSFEGAFEIAPSAAGVVYNYYKHRLNQDYSELIRETDRIDSADLNMGEVMFPEKNPYVLLSMTITGNRKEDEPYWNRIIDLLRKKDINDVIKDPEVKTRCGGVAKENKEYKGHLLKHTTMKKHVAITDFRSFKKTPVGNRFLVYSLFSESVVNVKIRYDNDDREKVIVSVGHSIFNRNCNVNVGKMLSNFEGGGHRGAGACNFHVNKADEYILKIIDILIKNRENSS
ncbi:MAG: exopolyphosphatase [Deltaproteobacteria bacterium]|nr:exopolyphosphatase [Deltaproteobacteria bacterium]MBW2217976.1 exopolyphosphatase [Deltaproteobacteria bacterium]